VNRFVVLSYQLFSRFVHTIEQTLFFDLIGIYLITLWVLVMVIFCTIRMVFIKIWRFKHAVDIALVRYDYLPKKSIFFPALATVLSASVGL
jgi:Na+/alanine symporter